MASEDSGEYPFPEDFNFDDLPDIDLETSNSTDAIKADISTPVTTIQSTEDDPICVDTIDNSSSDIKTIDNDEEDEIADDT